VFLRLGFFIGDDTPFRRVRVLPPAARLDWRAGVLSVAGSYARSEASDMTRDAALDAYIDTFRGAVRRASAGDGSHVLPLSGGRDSRHILFELCARGIRPSRCLTLRNYPPRGSRDIEIAAELTHALDLPHEIVEEYPSRAAAELRKNVATHFCADEHAWFLSLADTLDGAGVTLWDGIAGDVLSNGHRLDPKRLALARAGRAEDLALSMLDEGLLRAVPRDTAQRLGRDAAVARLADEIRRHVDAPNPIGSFFFWNRTRREIALVPFGLWDRVGRVATPYLDPRVFDLLTALPAEMFIDRRFHADAIRRAFPQYAHLRFDNDSALPAVRRPERTPADARHYRRLLKESAAYVWRAPAPTYVRRAWVVARTAYWRMKGDFSDAQVMPGVLYLAQLETMSRWAGANGRAGA
jgi:asparagine synthetase B (glutamine-hydrolysing)